jgi:hypothetical protein
LRYASSNAASSPACAPRKPSTTRLAHSKYSRFLSSPQFDWRHGDNVAQIADLVRELHELRAMTDMRRMFDLQALSFGLRQGLVVRHFSDDVRDFRAEPSHELVVRRGRILDRVVQNGRKQHALVVYAAFVGEHVRKRDRMIDIRRRLRVLAALIAMFVRGERDGPDQLIHWMVSLRRITKVYSPRKRRRSQYRPSHRHT